MGIISEIKNAIDLKDIFCNYYKKRQYLKTENKKIEIENKVKSNNTIKSFIEYENILKSYDIDVSKNFIMNKRHEIIENKILELIKSIKNNEDTADLEKNILNLIKLSYDDINIYFKQNLQNSSNKKNMVWY